MMSTPEPIECPEEQPRPWWQEHRESLGVTICSLCLHIALLAVLAIVVIPSRPFDVTQFVTIRTEVIENPRFETVDNLQITPEKLLESELNDSASLTFPTNLVSDQPSPTTIDSRQEQLQVKAEALEFLGQNHRAGEFAGRTEEARALLAKAFGGTATSEAAVARGLLWLKNHQRKDGSWSFDHRHGDCDGTCGNPGTLTNNPVGATAMALLCYVGAGHTHLSGQYQPQVAAGLEFLTQKYQEAEVRGDMRGLTSGNSGMYVQGIATIVLCELFGLTRDRKLRTMSQNCVDFIIKAQHPENGGWRYRLNQADGDTSVVGWQIMAMTSAQMSGLSVPGRVKVRAERFLDSVQLENGAYYGYANPQKKASTTSIGLLCRMYYGWDHSHPGMANGVKYLSTLGPSKDNQYYNYYATQVLHHWGGREWEKWNAVMREQLVSTQIQTGHGAGSWNPVDPHGRTGGRLYSTCLSILTLEVYYRHLPLYQRRQFKTDL